MDVYEAVTSRRSVRGFKNQPVAKEILERVLSAAAWSPSGSNIQPWNTYVMTGAPLAELKTSAVERVAHGTAWDKRQYEMYPSALKTPYGERRSAFGKERYSALGIARERWVFLHGCAELDEKLPVLERPDYSRSPAIGVMAAAAFGMAGIGIDDVELKGFAEPDSVFALVPGDDPGLAEFEAGRKALDQQLTCKGLAHLAGVDRGMLQQAAKIVAARYRRS